MFYDRDDIFPFDYELNGSGEEGGEADTNSRSILCRFQTVIKSNHK